MSHGTITTNFRSRSRHTHEAVESADVSKHRWVTDMTLTFCSIPGTDQESTHRDKGWVWLAPGLICAPCVSDTE